MLYIDYISDSATHADIFRRRYRMSKELFMEILHGVREFDPLLQSEARRGWHSWLLVNPEMQRHHEDACITSRKKGFHSPQLVPKLFDPRLKGALVPVHSKMWAKEH
jgi:hypothetical protein